MNLDDILAEAAAAISRMPEADFAVSLEQLEAEHRRRQGDDIARARHAAFLDSLELEQAAYELGRRHDEEGNLGEAARWYRVAASHDYADAALRLGEVLDLLAGRCARQADVDSNQAQRDELRLITDAAQAYSEAYSAGYTEAADKIDEMLAAVARRQASPPRRTVPTETVELTRPCSYVRDFTPENGVLHDKEIQRLSQHAAQCLSCMEEFIILVRAAASATPAGTVTDPFTGAGPPARPSPESARALHRMGQGRRAAHRAGSPPSITHAHHLHTAP
ncbi:MAG: hypothetical protein ACRDOO_00360 [Actinomadura sp.]